MDRKLKLPLLIVSILGVLLWELGFPVGLFVNKSLRATFYLCPAKIGNGNLPADGVVLGWAARACINIQGPNIRFLVQKWFKRLSVWFLYYFIQSFWRPLKRHFHTPEADLWWWKQLCSLLYRRMEAVPGLMAWKGINDIWRLSAWVHVFASRLCPPDFPQPSGLKGFRWNPLLWGLKTPCVCVCVCDLRPFFN